MPPSTNAPDPPRRKATLFCQDCGHESTLTGDWLVRDACGHRRFECPDCGDVVANSSSSPGVCAD